MTHDALNDLSRELADLIALTHRAAAKVEAGGVSPSGIDRLTAWEASAAHLFRRHTAALARLRAFLGQAVDLPT